MIIKRFLTWVDAAPSSQRAEAAGALARAFLISNLSQDEYEVADAALTLLLDDPAPDVRKALAKELGASADAPHHIIVALARDKADIASLVLSQSPLFVDGELVDYIELGDAQCQIAVAQRDELSETITDALCEFGEAEACRAMLENEEARYTSIGLMYLANRMGHDASIRSKLLEFETLPCAAREVLLEKHALELGAMLADRDWLPQSNIDELMFDALEKGRTVLAARVSDEEAVGLVQHLINRDAMTPAFLLRSLCAGDIDFFERTMAQLVGISIERMRSVVRSGNLSTFSSAYQKSSLPEEAFDVFAAALSVTTQWKDVSFDSQIKQLPRRVMEEILARCDGKLHSGTVGASIKLLRRLAAEAARDSAREYALEVSRAA